MFEFLGNLIRGGAKAGGQVVVVVPHAAAGILGALVGQFLHLVNEGYKKNALVFRCINLLATSTAEAPLGVYLRDAKRNEVEQPDHPLARLLLHPNPEQTRYQMIELLVIQLKICGISCWLKRRASGTGKPIALWPLRPDRLAPVRVKKSEDGEARNAIRARYGLAPLGASAAQAAVATTGELVAWRYQIEDLVAYYPPEDVILHNQPDPSGEDGGLSGGLGDLQVIARDVDSDNEARNFAFAFVRNYAMPGILIKIKKALTREEAADFKAGFATKYGAMHRGEPAVVSGQDADVVPLSPPLGNIGMGEITAGSESMICAGFGVPGILVGAKSALDRSTYANYEQARAAFTETTLSTLWQRLGDSFTVSLAPDFDQSGKLYCKFNTSEIAGLATQRIAKTTQFKDAFLAGGCTRNEFRQALALGPLPSEVGDVILVPMTMIEQPAGLERPLPKVTEPPPVAGPPPVTQLPPPTTEPSTPPGNNGHREEVAA